MSPEPSAPDAVPVTGATALAIVPLALFRSSIPAPIAPAAAPVDRPWMIRAISSCGTVAAEAPLRTKVGARTGGGGARA